MESPLNEQALFDFLDAHDIAHTTHRHQPVFTVEEAQAARAHMPGGSGHGHSKNLFVRDKKKNFALVIAEESAPIDLKALAGQIDMGRLSFASAERLGRYLGVKPGSVTPFALLHAMKFPAEDQPYIRVILDERLMAFDLVYFHPLHNCATTSIQPKDLVKFMRACGADPRISAL